MGHAANFGEGLFGFGPDGNKSRMKKAVAGANAKGLETMDALNPPALPKPPNALDSQITAGQAMTAAANRLRKSKGGGYGSTFSHGPAGDPSQAPTIRKGLIGL